MKATRMMHRVVCFVMIGFAAFAVQGAELFKWVDEKGRIHYGESVPEQYKKKAAKIEPRVTEPTDAQRRDAAERLAKEKLRAESTEAPSATPNAPPSNSRPQPAASDTSVKEDSCEEQKRRYVESDLCFAPYRNATGGIRAEAFQHCVEVKEPRC
jgi:hypothetical protein